MKIYDYKGRKNLCGNRVKEARARLKITQEDLAARLQVEGITMERDSVSRYDHNGGGNPARTRENERNPPGLGGFLCFVEVVAWDTYLAIYQKQTVIKLKPS